MRGMPIVGAYQRVKDDKGFTWDTMDMKFFGSVILE